MSMHDDTSHFLDPLAALLLDLVEKLDQLPDEVSADVEEQAVADVQTPVAALI